MPIISRPNIIKDIYYLFIRDSLRFKNIIIKPESFIVPAGLYGQFMSYSSSPKSIIGFLDNDISKHNKRVYGTLYYVYPFDEILKYDNFTIYIIGGLYNNEIIKQLSSYNKNIEIIIV